MSLDDKRANAISFTALVVTGYRIAQACVARVAKFQLEMGGKNPMVVLDDACLDVAVNGALNSGFFSTGQRCGLLAADRHRRHLRPLHRCDGGKDEGTEARRRVQEGHLHRSRGRR